MITSVENPTNSMCGKIYFAIYSVLRFVILAYFFLSVVYNDMYKTFLAACNMPMDKHEEWIGLKNFAGDEKNWI